ncbi:MFS transporter [Kitasatospora sp. NPDC059722]|uniref:MFS transporter n=1 Tax=unclassified Kitasatospora TaxID=2633591 RepID=UPI0036472058
MSTAAAEAAPGSGEEEAAPRPSLWRNADFTKLWIGQSASLFAAQISEFALPLTAVLALAASSQQVGLLSTTVRLPYLLVSLFAGVLVDRVRRRNLMAAADLGRALILGLVPVLYAMHRLGIGWLYVLGFLAGCCTVLFDVAAQAYLPRLVDREDLAAGNSALGSSQSAATIGGPAIGGVLVQWLSAPLAVAAASVSYLLSVLNIWLIRHREQPAEPTGDGGAAGTLRQVREGLRLVFRNEPLRTMTLMASTFNLSFTAFEVVFVQYMPHTLGLSAGEIGLVMAALGPGFLVGAVFAGRLPKKLGYGRTMLLTACVANLVMPLIALVRGSGPVETGALMAVNFVFASFGVANNVTMVTIRQSITPDSLQGRVAATNRFVAMGIAPVGALVGGGLGSLLGLRTTVLITTLGFCLALIPLGTSSLVRIKHRLPDPISDELRSH